MLWRTCLGLIFVLLKVNTVIKCEPFMLYPYYMAKGLGLIDSLTKVLFPVFYLARHPSVVSLLFQRQVLRSDQIRVSLLFNLMLLHCVLWCFITSLPLCMQRRDLHISHLLKKGINISKSSCYGTYCISKTCGHSPFILHWKEHLLLNSKDVAVNIWL